MQKFHTYKKLNLYPHLPKEDLEKKKKKMEKVKMQEEITYL